MLLVPSFGPTSAPATRPSLQRPVESEFARAARTVQDIPRHRTWTGCRWTVHAPSSPLGPPGRCRARLETTAVGVGPCSFVGAVWVHAVVGTVVETTRRSFGEVSRVGPSVVEVKRTKYAAPGSLLSFDSSCQQSLVTSPFMPKNCLRLRGIHVGIRSFDGLLLRETKYEQPRRRGFKRRDPSWETGRHLRATAMIPQSCGRWTAPRLSCP